MKKLTKPNSGTLHIICEVFHCTEGQIANIELLKKGMTNHSFTFDINGEKFIIRVPGEGTDRLINRHEEAVSFSAIKGTKICDDPVYLNPENGIKITRFLDGVRTCDPFNQTDLINCMDKLASFHEMKLTVPHQFDLFGKIDFYEDLWNGKPSIYKDYAETKERVFGLIPFINSCEKQWCLTHVDAVPDNFLIYQTDNGEAIQLTDWEYAGMQDPHLDIAMFCIYSMYQKEDCDHLIDLYFKGNCDLTTRTKIYCYIAASGLLWSNWCEYKRQLGIEFGEYSFRQYQYAKDFYQYALERI